MTRPARPEKSMATRVLSKTLLWGCDRMGKGQKTAQVSLGWGLGAHPHLTSLCTLTKGGEPTPDGCRWRDCAS